MDRWVRLCAVNDAPKRGQVIEKEALGVAICLANIEGRLAALENWCPHRRGALGQGWIEGNAVVCPLHAWSFDTLTGIAEEPEHASVAVFRLRTEGDEILVDIG